MDSPVEGRAQRKTDRSPARASVGLDPSSAGERQTSPQYRRAITDCEGSPFWRANRDRFRRDLPPRGKDISLSPKHPFRFPKLLNRCARLAGLTSAHATPATDERKTENFTGLQPGEFLGVRSTPQTPTVRTFRAMGLRPAEMSLGSR